MILSDNDIFEQSIALQKEGSDTEEHDECLLLYVNEFGDEGDKRYAQALIELNRMIEIL